MTLNFWNEKTINCKFDKLQRVIPENCLIDVYILRFMYYVSLHFSGLSRFIDRHKFTCNIRVIPLVLDRGIRRLKVVQNR